jgi:hypothetical protein
MIDGNPERKHYLGNINLDGRIILSRDENNGF